MCAIETQMNITNNTSKLNGLFLSALITFLFMTGPTPLQAVKSNKVKSKAQVVRTVKKAPAIPEAIVSKFEKRAKHAMIFSAIGVAMVIGVVAILSLGTMSGALPLLGLAGLFANIGFIKAMRLRQHTKSRKRTFRKARWRAKTAIILSCVLGITLIFGLLSFLLNKPDVF